MCLKVADELQNTVDPDQTPRSVVSDRIYTVWSSQSQRLNSIFPPLKKYRKICNCTRMLYRGICKGIDSLTFLMLNKLRCHAHFHFPANQITWSGVLIEIHMFTDKQCRSRSVGFFRSQHLDLQCLLRYDVSYLSKKRVKERICTCTNRGRAGSGV